jgi:DNA-binding CsgD family transcriptional regulator
MPDHVARLLFESLHTPEALPEALGLIARDMDADGFIWNDLPDPDAPPDPAAFRRVVSPGFSVLSSRDPFHVWQKLADPRLHLVLERADRVNLVSRRLGRGFGRDDYHQTVLEGHYGTRWTCGSAFTDAATGRPLALLGLHRFTDHGDFTVDAERHGERWMPLLRGYAQARRRLGVAGQARLPAAEAADALASPLLLIDLRDRPRWRNAAAQALLRAGRPWRLAEGRLIASGADAPAFRNACAAVRHSGLPRSLVLHDEPGTARWRVDLLMRPEGLLVQGRDLRPDPEALGRALRDALDLTAAELRVALGLAEGRNAVQHAQASGLRLATVRFHIRHLLAKTQCADLQALQRLLGHWSVRN